jgi:GT2 family glycosyltransferase
MADAIMNNCRLTVGEGQQDAAARPEIADTAAPLELSIVIVTWNSERWIERCLRSVAAACDGLPHEVTVYDNASTDATLRSVDAVAGEVPDDAAEQIRVIRGTENCGFAAATNRGIAASRGEYVFLLNPDCELDRRALRVLHDFLSSHPEVAAAVPLLVDESGDSQREFQLRRLPSLRTLAYDALGVDRLLPRNRSVAHYRYRDLDLTGPQRVEQPAAAAMLLRRRVIDEVGTFDEQFVPAWFEDVDYCRRLAAAGKPVFVVPAVGARHFGGSSLENLSFAEFTDVWYRNMWRYAVKWFPRPKAEALRWIIIASMILRCGAALAGIPGPKVGRWEAFHAYRQVLERAFRRWSPC